MENNREHVRETLVVLDRDHPRFKEANLRLSYDPVEQLATPTVSAPIAESHPAAERSNVVLQARLEKLRLECEEKTQNLDKAVSESKGLPTELDMAQSRCKEMRSENESLRRECGEKTQKLNKAISESKALALELVIAQRRCTSENEALRRECNEKTQRLNKAISESKALASELTIAREKGAVAARDHKVYAVWQPTAGGNLRCSRFNGFSWERPTEIPDSYTHKSPAVC